MVVAVVSMLTMITVLAMQVYMAASVVVLMMTKQQWVYSFNKIVRMMMHVI